ncbi:hypothetical protein [Parasediminibacterium sp. JCM 36343]|uniref:hypothetical protein n=1 Tax=Parasediminibacterium sp. JCM 36343 TaxID=3374279 RepID=UPI00397C3BB6
MAAITAFLKLKQKKMEQTKKQIALMAEYFEKRVTTSDLAEWLGNTMLELVEWQKCNPTRDATSAANFIAIIGSDVLVPLIKCKGKTERIEVLRKGIVYAFHFCDPECLNIISQGTMQSYTKYSPYTETATRHFAMIGVLMSVCEMHVEYKWALGEEIKKAA